jgi:hypothetical protein
MKLLPTTELGGTELGRTEFDGTEVAFYDNSSVFPFI